MTCILAMRTAGHISVTADRRQSFGNSYMDTAEKLIDMGQYVIAVAGAAAQHQLIYDAVSMRKDHVPDTITPGSGGRSDIRQLLSVVRSYGTEYGLLACEPEEDGTMLNSSGINVMIASDTGHIYQAGSYDEVIYINRYVWGIGSGAQLAMGYASGRWSAKFMIGGVGAGMQIDNDLAGIAADAHTFTAELDTTCSASIECWQRKIEKGQFSG